MGGPGGLLGDWGGHFGFKSLSIRGHDVFFPSSVAVFGPVSASSGLEKSSFAQVRLEEIWSELNLGRRVWPVRLSIVELAE